MTSDTPAKTGSLVQFFPLMMGGVEEGASVIAFTLSTTLLRQKTCEYITFISKV